MRTFIRRAGCTEDKLTEDLLSEWDSIKAELPREWERALREQEDPPSQGDIVRVGNTYYRKGQYGSLEELKLDVLGQARGLAQYTSEGRAVMVGKDTDILVEQCGGSRRGTAESEECGLRQFDNVAAASAEDPGGAIALQRSKSILEGLDVYRKPGGLDGGRLSAETDVTEVSSGIWCQCFAPGMAMLLTLFVNIVVCSEFSYFPLH